MSSRSLSLARWLVAGGALALAASLIVSPRFRTSVTSSFTRVTEQAGHGSSGMRARRRQGRHMAALEEISGSLDTATTQFESSMTVSKVAAALAQDPRLRSEKIEVRIIGGIIHLEGSVRREGDKALAGEIAQRASGAQLIANDLTVSSPIG